MLGMLGDGKEALHECGSGIIPLSLEVCHHFLERFAGAGEALALPKINEVSQCELCCGYGEYSFLKAAKITILRGA
jgi:hypothetical protein